MNSSVRRLFLKGTQARGVGAPSKPEQASLSLQRTAPEDTGALGPEPWQRPGSQGSGFNSDMLKPTSASETRWNPNLPQKGGKGEIPRPPPQNKNPTNSAVRRELGRDGDFPWLLVGRAEIIYDCRYDSVVVKSRVEGQRSVGYAAWPLNRSEEVDGRGGGCYVPLPFSISTTFFCFSFVVYKPKVIMLNFHVFCLLPPDPIEADLPPAIFTPKNLILYVNFFRIFI